jgi:hypothetical protein
VNRKDVVICVWILLAVIALIFGNDNHVAFWASLVIANVWIVAKEKP